MIYTVTASPIKNHKIVKTVDGVRELHDYLTQCRDFGLEIRQVRRVRPTIVQLATERLVA